MERTLTRPDLGRRLLQWRLAAGRIAAMQWLLAALYLLALGAGGLALQWRQQLATAAVQQDALREQISLLRQAATRRSAAAAAPPTAEATPASPPLGASGTTMPGHLAQFQAVLAEHEALEPSIETLFALAKSNGLVLRLADYQYSRDSASGIYQCQISLPVQGDYASIWTFALEVLQALPFAALQDISFRRNAIAEPTPQALLRVTLYLNQLNTP